MIVKRPDAVKESSRHSDTGRNRLGKFMSPGKPRPTLLIGIEQLKADKRRDLAGRQRSVLHACQTKFESIAQRLKVQNNGVDPFESLLMDVRSMRREIWGTC